ncbi:hypothetical protein HMI54_012478 [Coelomomyces lativittatus]|nr:hypothetical protein HMI54_012478 [Coelomomyces lativittatus]
MEALKILKINPKFIQREERPDDIHYACKLILVWNAAFSQPNIHTYLPKFMLKQIPFLSQRYPDAFPPPQWKTLLSKIEDSETSLIQYVTHQLMSITMETQRTTLYEMVMRVRQQCSTSPSSHLSFLLDLADLFFLAHDISYEKVGPKNANHLQQAIQRIQTVYQVEFHSSSTSSLSPGLQTPFTSMAASFSDSFSSIVDSIRTFPFTSISHVFKRQVKLDSPQANSEHQPHSVSNHFTFACELHLSPTMPSLWACITWPDASKEWMSLPVLPCPTIHVPPRSWSDVSSVQIQVGQFASSLPLMDEPSSFNSSKNTFVPLSNSISLWFRYSLLM